MHKRTKTSITTLLVFLTLLPLWSQQNSSKLWTSVAYKHALGKQFETEWSQHFRVKDDFENVDTHITQGVLGFSPKKRWKIEAELRYLYRNDTRGGIQGFENMWRYRFNIEKKIKIPQGNLELRLGYQNRQSFDRDNRKKKKWRFRPSYEWKIKNWSLDPKFFFEYLHTYGNQKERSYRYGIGTKKKLNKQTALAFRYLFEHTVENNRPESNNHILSLKYVFSQKKKKEEVKSK